MTWAIGVGVVALLVLLSRSGRAQGPARRQPGMIIGPLSGRGVTYRADASTFPARAQDLIRRARSGAAGAEELARAIGEGRALGLTQTADLLAFYLEQLSLTRASPTLRARLAQAFSPSPPSTEALDALAAQLDPDYPMTARAVRGLMVTGPAHA